jgi:3-phosphoshikimate 1-carboxyvinyltransferase
MALAWTGEGARIEIEGELISKPYVDLTRLSGALRRGGGARGSGALSRFRAARPTYRPGSLEVEGDASSASYFLAMGALGGGPCA